MCTRLHVHGQNNRRACSKFILRMLYDLPLKGNDVVARKVGRGELGRNFWVFSQMSRLPLMKFWPSLGSHESTMSSFVTVLLVCTRLDPTLRSMVVSPVSAEATDSLSAHSAMNNAYCTTRDWGPRSRGHIRTQQISPECVLENN